MNELAVYTRPCTNIIISNTMQETAAELDTTTNYAPEDYLHSGLLIFGSVFPQEKDGRVILDKVMLFENESTLWMPDLRLLLFNSSECDIVPVKNAQHNWTTFCTLENCVAIVDIVSANWKSQAHYSGSLKTEQARAVVSVGDIITNEPLNNTIRQTRDLVGFLLVKGANLSKFQSGAKFKVSLQVTQA